MSRASRKRWAMLHRRARADVRALRQCREALAGVDDPPAEWTEAERSATWEAEPETRAALEGPERGDL